MARGRKSRPAGQRRRPPERPEVPTTTDWQPALALSRAMREAARQGEWDTLAALETQRRACWEAATDEALRSSSSLRAMAEEILQIDRDILDLVGPYLDQLRPWIERPKT